MTRKLELIEAKKALRAQSTTIITLDQEEEIKADGFTISVLPFWRSEGSV